MYGVEEVKSTAAARAIQPGADSGDADHRGAGKAVGRVSADGVRIRWSGPRRRLRRAGVTYLYRVMRRPVGAAAFIVIDDVAPSASGSYLDKTFGWEQKYEYRITTLSQVQPMA